MRLRHFIGQSLKDAVAQARAALGQDAVILSTRQVSDGVEIRAAVERAPSPLLQQRAETALDESRNAPIEVPRADDHAAQGDQLHNAVYGMLAWNGFPVALAQTLADAAKSLAPRSDLQTALTAVLETCIGFAPIALTPSRPLLIVGPPGAGKTSVTAKLCARARSAGKRLIAVSGDLDQSGDRNRLAAYLEREPEAVIDGSTFEALQELGVQRRKRLPSPFVIDAPAINPFDDHELNSLQQLVDATAAEPILVIDASGHPEDQADAAKAYAQIGCRRAIITKIDTARRRGGVLAALSGARMSLAQMSLAPFIDGGLIPANAAHLARLLSERAPSPVQTPALALEGTL